MIYLDNAATTAPNKEALRIATQKYEELFYNPSASYRQGAEVHALIEDCKRTILETLTDDFSPTDKYDIVFTASGSEANNLAVHINGNYGNVVISDGEHASVCEAAMKVSSYFVRDDEYLHERTECSCVDTKNILNPIGRQTQIVSVIHVGNETGEAFDIYNIARAVKQYSPCTLFHSDGVQAYGKIPFKLTPDIDMYSISAHKIGGIKGVGALVYRKEVKDRLRPIIYGGGQGNGLRSGTENVLGIIDFAEAVKRWFRFDNEDDFYDRVTDAYPAAVLLQKKLWSLLDKRKFVRISPEDGSPYILTVSARGKNNEVIQKILEEKYGILVGIGSACSSNHAENKGRVLRALGYGDDIINGALRFSFSPQTTVEEIRTAAKAVNEVVWSLS